LFVLSVSLLTGCASSRSTSVSGGTEILSNDEARQVFMSRYQDYMSKDGHLIVTVIDRARDWPHEVTEYELTNIRPDEEQVCGHAFMQRSPQNTILGFENGWTGRSAGTLCLSYQQIAAIRSPGETTGDQIQDGASAAVVAIGAPVALPFWLIGLGL
jgi:hypothetical protein